MSLTALLSRLSASTLPGGEPIVRLAAPFDRVDKGIGFTSFVFTLTESMAKTFYEIRDVLPPELVGVSVFTLTGMEIATATMRVEPGASVVALGRQNMISVGKIDKNARYWSHFDAFFEVTRENVRLVAGTQMIATMPRSELLCAVKRALGMDVKEVKNVVAELFAGKSEGKDICVTRKRIPHLM